MAPAVWTGMLIVALGAWLLSIAAAKPMRRPNKKICLNALVLMINDPIVSNALPRHAPRMPQPHKVLQINAMLALSLNYY